VYVRAFAYRPAAGYLLRSLARRLLKIPVLRYVDDLFGADRRQCADGALDALARPRVHTALRRVAPTCPHVPPFRLVRACLGPAAIAERKLEIGMPLVILGISVRCVNEGVRFTLDEKKRHAWRAQVEAALACGQLNPGACFACTRTGASVHASGPSRRCSREDGRASRMV